MDLEYLKVNSEKTMEMMREMFIASTRKSDALKDDLLPKFPIPSYDSFMSFDNTLADHKVYDQMVRTSKYKNMILS